MHFTHPIYIWVPKWWPPRYTSGDRRLVHGGVKPHGGSPLCYNVNSPQANYLSWFQDRGSFACLAKPLCRAVHIETDHIILILNTVFDSNCLSSARYK